MDSQKQQAAERIKQANNILVTVSSNPSVDQLAACIGLTLSLNKMGKHATAVFSGTVPSTLEFLQPEKTIEKNTDSLRDFIIALDKSKADKLRYKVEDKVVKIFITPYRTSISDKDLEFSQGDFNVDVVLALGVHSQADLDQAIVSHGRILHDATIITMNSKPGGEFGSINWLDVGTSSLSELSVQLVDVLDKKLMDGQIATSFLTGIVAETERFSNIKTSPQTMSISAELMAAGANQQLVATKLEEPELLPATGAPLAHQEGSSETEPVAPKKASNDGTLEIAHDEKESAPAVSLNEVPVPTPEQLPSEEYRPIPEPIVPASAEETLPEPTPEIEPPQIKIDEHGAIRSAEETELPPLPKAEPPSISHHREGPRMVLEPPTLGGALSASGSPTQFGETEPHNDEDMPSGETNPSLPDSMKGDTPSFGSTIMPPAAELPQNAPGTSFLGDQPLLPSDPELKVPDAKLGVGLPDEYRNQTLTDIEKDVQSPHLDQPVLSEDNESTDETNSLDNARNAVENAINGAVPGALPPVDALNAQPVNLPMGGLGAPNDSIPVVPPIDPGAVPVQPWMPSEAQQPVAPDVNVPPPGPPPMMPQPLP